MNFLFEMEFCAPVYQIALLLVLSTTFLLLGKAKIGLLVSYVFILYWGYVLDREYLLEHGMSKAEYFPWVYFGFGFLILSFALFGFFTHRNS